MSLNNPCNEEINDVDHVEVTNLGIDVNTAFGILSRRTAPLPHQVTENENPNDVGINSLQQNLNLLSFKGGCGCCPVVNMDGPYDYGSSQQCPPGQSIDIGTASSDRDNISGDELHTTTNINTPAPEILDKQKVLLESQQLAVERQEQLSSTLQSMTVNDIVVAIFHTQEERVKCYHFFDEGLAYVLETSNLDYYPLVCADVTATFTVLSSTINAIRSDLQNRSKQSIESTRGIREIAEQINRLQRAEQTKLQLTAALHLERIRIQAQQQQQQQTALSEIQPTIDENNHRENDTELPVDSYGQSKTEQEGRVSFLLEESVNALRERIALAIEEINDVLEELRFTTIDER